MTEITLWSVIDRNAVSAPRSHDIPIKVAENGDVLLTKTYKLTSDIPTKMPEDHARLFLVDKAFVVCDGNGNEVAAMPKREVGAKIELSEDEVIANYAELSKEALYARCKLIAGADEITQKSKPDDMIDFLKSKSKKTIGKSRGSEGVIGELSVEELDSLLAV